MAIAGIYKITNLINGKAYIGKSSNIEIRWKNHVKVVSLLRKILKMLKGLFCGELVKVAEGHLRKYR